MTMRKVVAVAILAALPVFVGAAQPALTHVAFQAPTAQALPVTQQGVAPRWGYAFGLNEMEALAFGIAGAIECAFFGPVGGIACGITGAL